MERKKLNRLQRDLRAARRAPQTEADLADLARRCGREVRSGSNHPMWISPMFPTHRPFPISRHGGNPIVAPHVRKVILSALEADLMAWEDKLELEEQASSNGGEGEDDEAI